MPYPIISHIFWNPKTELFHFPNIGLSLYWYGLLWAIGLILSRQVGLYIFLRDKRYTEDLPRLFFYIVVPAVLGARLGHFLFYDIDIFLTDPLEIITPPFSGMASHGGVAGIIIGVLAFCRIHHWNYLWVIDRLAIVALIPGVTIRLGNLINSEIIGKPADLPWSFIFARVDLVPRHPAQLYEAICYLILFFVFFWLWKNHSQKFGNGFFLGGILTSLWIARLAIEFVKENQVPFEKQLPLNMGQLLSVPFILLGLALIYYSFRKGPDPYHSIISNQVPANYLS
ncbi:prolipoprotein diacylglyceryl transferase [Echinicola marina]|uniref:prolipoprotein diacylglyceryl transferase n=1 Tax=Echinicola marina TaxID=2859768 RepID=UPI001CF6D514|nr:prolipoprotein diacylglyceryl transferase [Echinicola marina]UCS93365.1 prolipoprotein diacylglyceryl transferase [Echinicola marina]